MEVVIFELLRHILPGATLFTTVAGVLKCLRGAILYLRSGGAADHVAKAKNNIIDGLMGTALTSVAMVGTWNLAWPTTTAQILQGMAVGAVLGASMFLLLSSTVVPAAVATYSAWWMPKAARNTHRQDIRYALRQADGGRRSSHAWGVLKSSPRVGLRARRHYKRLAAAMTGSPARTRISN